MVNFRILFFCSVRSLTQFAFAIAFWVISAHCTATRSEALPSAGIGAWNRYLGQSNVIECWNESELPARAQLTVRDNFGNQIAIESIPFSAHGSYHYILDAVAGADSYGTFAVAIQEGEAQLRCATLFYGIRGGSPQFSYSLPLLAETSGNLLGTFNSFHPTDPQGTILNWLAIYNPNPAPFSADVLVYGQAGNLEQTIEINALAGFARTDIALGHPAGRKVGLYQIRPRNGSQAYGSYLARFAVKNGAVGTAYSLLPIAGSGTLTTVGTSTMGGMQNWLEIGNAADETIGIEIQLKSQQGRVLATKEFELSPHAQQHVYVNDSLGAESIGKAEIYCTSENCRASAVLAQSLFYGISGGELRWAYGSQGLPLGAASGQALSYPLNTFFQAANWLKLTAQSANTVSLSSSAYDGAGRPLRLDAALPVSGTADIPFHALLGSNQAGYTSLAPTVSTVTSELIRVFPGLRPGEIQHINPIRSIGEYNRAFEMVRDGIPSPGRISGSFDAIERKTVEIGGQSVEKIVVRGWACRPGSAAPITITVQAGSRVLGSGTADMHRSNVALCPGMDFQAFSFELTVPSDLSLSGLELHAIATDELGILDLHHYQTTKILEPALLYSAFDNRFPKGIFFRSGLEFGTETDLRGDTGKWVADFSQLDGAFAKVLNEEVDTIDTPLFAGGLRKIAAQPGQLALLHFNAVGLLPTQPEARNFGPQDWLYLTGCDLAEPTGSTGLTFTLPEACFYTYRKCIKGPHTGEAQAPACIPDNLVAVERSATGTLDWSKFEYVIVSDVQLSSGAGPKTIVTVQRGQFGSSARTFPRGSYLAPLSGNGPWRKTSSQILWNYNFARASARTRVSQLLAAKFAPGGVLDGIDGITLDVSWWYRAGEFDANAQANIPGRRVDINSDNVADGGYAGSVNLYGQGTAQFRSELKQRLGPNKIVLADGGVSDSARDFNVINGTENEGFGNPDDDGFVTWSTAVNRLRYTQNRTTAPNFRYIVHKNVPGAAAARLVMAGATALDAAFAGVVNPRTEMFTQCNRQQWDANYNRNGLPVLDELVRGQDKERHWLGRPIEGLRRPALVSPVVNPPGVEDLRTLIVAGTGNPVTVVQGDAQTMIAPNTPGKEFTAVLPGLSAVSSKDIVLEFEIRSGGDLAGFEGAGDIPRVVTVSTTANVLPPRAPGVPNSKQQDGLFGSAWTKVVVYFRNDQTQDFQFGLRFEGGEPVFVRGMKLHHAADVLIRRFEHGVVVANPSYRPAQVDLGRIFPNAIFRRLRATLCQDTAYNDGRVQDGVLELAPKDGIFLIDVAGAT